MTDKEAFSDPATRLRRRAEETARNKAAQAPERARSLSPDQAGQLIHELQVHQIELEIQNEDLRAAQAELESARERYFDLYDLAPVGYLTVGENGLILEANRATGAMLVAARNALSGKPITRFIHKEDQDTYYRHREQLSDTDEPQDCDLRMVKNDGTAFWANLRTITARDATGAMMTRIVLSDISENKFREDERQLAAHLIVEVSNPDGLRERMSRLTTSLQAWSGCEAVGIRLSSGDDYPYYETRGFPPEFVSLENRLCAYGPDGKILRDGTGDPVLECMCGNILRGRFDPDKPFFTDRGSFWSNNTTAWHVGTSETARLATTCNRCNSQGYESVALIPLRAGREVFGLLQFNDHRPGRFSPDMIAHLERIADSLAVALSRRQDEEALREQRNVLNLLFESVPSILILMNSACRVDDINHAGIRFANRKKERLLNHLAGHVLGCLNSSRAEDCGRNEECTQCPIRSRVMHTFSSGESVFNEEDRLTVRRGDEVKIFNFLISTSLIKGKDRDQVLVAITDIASLKQAEKEREDLRAQLNQAQKMEAVGQLAGGVAHDFNNVLAAMMMRMESMRDNDALTPGIREDLIEMEADVKRSADLTRRLLLFGRRQVMQIKVLDLNDLLVDLFKMLRRVLGEQNLMTFEGSPSPLWIDADRGMIEQVVINLCVNARDAMPKGGNLVLSTQSVEIDEQHAQIDPDARVGRFACLAVSDQGGGIDEATLEHIFEPFFTTKEIGKGTGLGLSTVYGILKQHNGWVKVESVMGRGTIFRVYLPMSAHGSQSLDEQSKAPVVRGSETILLVEDERDLRTLVAQLMRRHGYKVIEAANGAEALREWEAHRDEIRLLFTDMVMPGGMAGLELARRLLLSKPDLRVIISSGYNIDLLGHEGAIAPNIAYVPKPCELDKLMKIIRESIDLSK